MTPRVHKLAWGNAGIRETVREMWRAILGGYDGNPAAALGLVRNQAETILRQYGVQFGSNALHAAAVHDWIQQHLAYVGDHVLIEEIRTPARLLLEIDDRGRGGAMGDCDDFVILEAALVSAIGIPSRIVTTSTRDDGEFNHTYLILDTTAGAVIADPILKDRHGRPQPFGAHVPPEVLTNYEEFPLPESLEELGVSMEGVTA